MISARKRYGLLCLLVLGAEVFIALYVNDRFLRPYGGDILVVLLLYHFVMFMYATLRRSRKYPIRKTIKRHIALGVLLFAFAMEILQALDLTTLLGLSENRLAQLFLGTTFSWMDIVAYTAGYGLLMMFINTVHSYNGQSTPQ